MAENEQVKNFRVGLGPSDETFQSYKQLQDVLGNLFNQLNQVKAAAASIQIEGNFSGKGDKGETLTAQLAALQRDMRSMLASIRTGGPNAQLNSSVLSGIQNQTRYSDSRVALEEARILNSEAERRVLLMKQENIAAEARKQYALEEIGLTREIQAATTRVAEAQERLTRAKVADNQAMEASATRDIRDGRARLDQLRQELDLRERGAKVRLGNALDGNGDTASAQLQLKAVQDAKAQLSDATRDASAAIRRAQTDANSQIRQQQAPINTAHSAALREDRTRDFKAERAAAEIGPSKQDFEKSIEKFYADWDDAILANIKFDKNRQKQLVRDWNAALKENKQFDMNKQLDAAQIGPSKDEFYKQTDQFYAAWDQAIQMNVTYDKNKRRKMLADWDRAILDNRKLDEEAARAAAQIGPPTAAFHASLEKFYADWDKATLANIQYDKDMQKRVMSDWNKAIAEEERRNRAQGTGRPAAEIREARFNQALGDGGASMAVTQTALTANYFVTQGIVQAFKSAIEFTVQYEEALAHLKTIANATQGQMDSMQGSIEAVSNATRYSAVDLTKAAAALSETGVTVKDMHVALQGVADLATATGEDFNKTVDTVTGALGSFKLQASDAVSVTNMIAEAVNSSRLTMDKLKLSIETAGETASEAGVSFKELLAANVAITNTGTASGATLGGGFRQLLTDLEKPSDAFKAALERLGLTQEDINVKTQGLYGALKNLHDAGFDAADAMQSFEARSASAFTALNSNLAEMATFQTTLNDSSAAAKATADQMNTLGAQFDRFKNQTSLVVGVAFKPLLDGFKDLVKAAADAETAVKGTSGALEIIGTIAGGAAIAVGTTYVGKLAGGLMGLATGGFAAAEGMAAVGATLGLWVGVAAAAAAGVAYLVSKLNDSEEAYDKQATATKNARDALESSKQSYDSIGATIDTLSNKMDALNKHPEMLQREIDDVGKQFEKYGETLDKSAIHKTEDLIDALKRLHDQMGQKYELNTVVLNQQLDLMTVEARKKAAEKAGSFGRTAFGGDDDKIRAAMATPDQLDYDPLTLAPRQKLNILPNGQRSKGEIPVEEGLTPQNLGSFIQVLSDLGVHSTDKVASGFKALMDPDALARAGQDPEKLRALKDQYDAAFGGIRGARIQLDQAGNRVGVTEEERTHIAGLDQAFENIQKKIQAPINALADLTKTVLDGRDTRNKVDQLDYSNNNAGAVARRKAIDSVIERSVATRTASLSGDLTLDDLWEAQKMAESGNRQFDAKGNVIRSKKGAVGVAQIRSATTGAEAAELAGLPWDPKRLENDPEYNEALGRAYMGKQLKTYGNSTLALAAYNMGPTALNNVLNAQHPDGTTNDPRVLSNQITETDFLRLLPPETQKYIARIGGAATGALGRYNRLSGDASSRDSVRELSDLMQQLEAQRAASKGNPKEQADVEAQLARVKAELNDWQRKYDSLRSDASPALKKVSEADEASLNAHLKTLNQGIGASHDIDFVQSANKEATDTIKAVYQDKIDLLRKTGKTALTANGTMDYTADVRQQIKALEDELAEKLEQQGQMVRTHIEKIRDVSENRDLKRRMDAEDTRFRQFNSRLKDKERDDDAAYAIDTRRAGQQLRNDSAEASYMNDPRWSGRYSQVQRAALSRKQAADSDIADQQTLAAQSAQALRIEEERQQAQAELNRINAQLSKVQDASKAYPKDSNDEKRANEEIKQLKDEQIKANDKLEASDTKRLKNAQSIAETEEKIRSKQAQPMNLMEGINAANENFLATHDEMATAIDGYNSLLGTAQNSFATFFDDLVTRSKSAGQAIKDFARSFLSAMLQILEQQAALALIKSIVGVFAGAAGSGAAAAAPGPGVMVGGAMPSPSIAVSSIFQGGVVSDGGTVTRGGALSRFAQGGIVGGGTPGRDSVHALLAPGESILNSDATAAVGEDFINGLNAQGNRVISKSTPAPAAKREKQPDHVNVWVVAPDQKPSLGPRDVLATISDDIMRGGSTKQLIKQVAMGQV